MTTTSALTAPELTTGDAPPRRRRSPRAKRVRYAAISLGTLLLLWSVASATGLVGPDVLPAPWTVVARFFDLLVHPYSGHTLLGHMAASLRRWGLGVLWAVLIGVPLGVLLAWVPVVRAAVMPAFEVLRYIPPFAWIPLAVLVLGASTEAQAAVVFVAAFPVCVINTQTGIVLVDPIFERAARSLGSGQVRTLTRVVLPDALPLIFTGIRTATSNGWMALVGAELVVGKEGLGFLIAQGQVTDSPSTILVGMISIGLVGTLVDIGLQRLQRLATPWQPSADRSGR